ncbi:MAG: bifunctional N-acetylglucosamine-1-phosphate uridyltransferase/glucosamine-1-phosphate acetyltransferase [Desulfobacterales bacterium]|nr:NTP transferase domain-containing protein [Deltaproteobacteria bacterium]NNK93318.1 bifunctional N-acetylglucosamine-1-phosphate uridyltransferase/glucosamine-1-phosphate acetyltransferase [Desulfobacterales bacterium]
MTASPTLSTIILAAGKGTRMKSAKAKVLHEVFFQPMIHLVLKAVEPLQTKQSIVIVGHQKEAVERVLEEFDVTCAEQKEQNGTGHAVLCAEPHITEWEGDVMILYGDSPLLLTQHLEEMYQLHRHNDSVLTVMTTCLTNPSNYGRIIIDNSGNVIEIVEEKDATEEQRNITEINVGIYCVQTKFLFEALKQVTTDNSQGEMYLTDIVAIAVKNGFTVRRYEHPHPSHVLGVNSRGELATAHMEIQSRRNAALMASGITLLNPLTTQIGPTVTIEPDSIIGPQVTITGTSLISNGCVIEAGVSLDNADVGTNAHIGANSVLNNCSVRAGEKILPLTYRSGKY